MRINPEDVDEPQDGRLQGSAVISGHADSDPSASSDLRKGRLVLRVPDPSVEDGINADRELVKRVITNDPAALRVFFVDRYGPALSALARRNANEENLIGAFFLYLAENDWRRLRTWDGTSRLGTWLHVVAARYFRRMGGGRFIEPLPDGDVASKGQDDPSELASQAEQAARVREAIESIPNEQQRLAVTLCDLSGMTPNEAAKKMGVGASNIYVLLHRGRNYVRDSLQRSERDG